MNCCKSPKGMFFDKKQWDEKPLPVWDSVRSLLPQPVYEANPMAVNAYWGAWEMAIRAMQSPHSGSGLVSNYMYFVFNNNEAIFAHDSSLMTMFGRFGHRAYSAIDTLDNFYACQHETGEICREINRITGEDSWPNREDDPMTVHVEDPWSSGYNGDWSKVNSYKWIRPTVNTHPSAHCAVDAMTDHKFAWAEMLNYRITGDASRLSRVIKPLCKWYKAMQVYLQGDNGLYITDWAGMDNSPRNAYLGYGVDISSQMVFTARLLAEMLEILGLEKDSESYRLEADYLAEIIRNRMWNSETGMFHDLTFENTLVPVKTVAGFWPLLAGIPDDGQLHKMVAQLENPATFRRPVMVPSLAADENQYTGWGEYYLGGVWPHTNAAIIEGLERYGETDLAYRIAKNYWNASVSVWRETATVWEYLAPEHDAPGRSENPDNSGADARSDFAGWGAYPLIATFLENVIGLRADAAANTIIWNLRETGNCGCRQFAFGNVVTDLIAKTRSREDEEPRINVNSNMDYTLILRWGQGQQKKIAVSGN